MCYSNKPRCTKHGFKGDTVETSFNGNIYSAICTEPGCDHEMIMERNIKIDPITRRQTIDFKVLKNNM